MNLKNMLISTFCGCLGIGTLILCCCKVYTTVSENRRERDKFSYLCKNLKGLDGAYQEMTKSKSENEQSQIFAIKFKEPTSKYSNRIEIDKIFVGKKGSEGTKLDAVPGIFVSRANEEISSCLSFLANEHKISESDICKILCNIIPEGSIYSALNITYNNDPNDPKKGTAAFLLADENLEQTFGITVRLDGDARKSDTPYGVTVSLVDELLSIPFSRNESDPNLPA